jgi:hypothetical protein
MTNPLTPKVAKPQPHGQGADFFVWNIHASRVDVPDKELDEAAVFFFATP